MATVRAVNPFGGVHVRRPGRPPLEQPPLDDDEAAYAAAAEPQPQPDAGEEPKPIARWADDDGDHEGEVISFDPDSGLLTIAERGEVDGEPVTAESVVHLDAVTITVDDGELAEPEPGSDDAPAGP